MERWPATFFRSEDSTSNILEVSEGGREEGREGVREGERGSEERGKNNWN